MPSLATLREQCEFYFDTGDAVKTGNLGAPLQREPVWERLAALGCTASVPGNREVHLLSSILKMKLKGATHPVLCANMRLKNGTRPLPDSTIVETRQSVRVGLVGVMAPMVTDRMAARFASELLWDQPVPVAVSVGENLRSQVDVLIALTHIGHKLDVLLANTGVFDVILGGHSHTVIEQPERVERTWICQGGSHARFAGTYTWRDGELTGQLHDLRTR